MWWMYIIVVALMAFGIFGFVSLVRLFEQRLTSETTRRAEDMYDQYADSLRERHRRSLAPRRYWPVLPNRVPTLSTEVRRALVGPGLWPGPRRQARWVGRGSGVNGAPKARPREARTRSTVDAGGADPDNARRSSPVTVTFARRSAHLARRRRPATSSRRAAPGDVTAGTGCGRCRGSRARQPPRPQGMRPKDASEAAAPQRRDPGDPGRLRPVIPAALLSLGCSRLLACTVPGRQARRAEGAPLKP